MLKYVILNLLFITTLTGIINYSAKFNPETQVSAGSTSYLYCNMKKLSNNNFIILYTESTSNTVKYQLIDSTGNKIGSLQTIPAFIFGNFNMIEPLANGKFIILYTELNGFNLLNAKILNNDGTLVTQVNDITTSFYPYFDIILLIVFDDGGFATLWSTAGGFGFYYKFYDATGNSLTNLIAVIDGSYIIYTPVGKAITNTSFMLCYKMDNGGSELVRCDLMSYTGGTGNPGTIDTNGSAGREIKTMSLAKLQSGNYVIAWSYASSFVYMAVFDSSFNIIVPRLTVSDYIPALNSNIVVHDNQEYSIFFEEPAGGGTKTEIVYQHFDIYNQKIGVNVVLTNLDQTRNYPSVVESSNYSLAACWSLPSTTQIYYNLFSPVSTNCQYFSVNIKALTNLSLKSSFTTYITNQNLDDILFYFSNLPSIGAFVTNSGSKISTNTAYKYDNINYNSPLSPASFNVTYSIVNSNTYAQSVCTMNIGVCYPTCETCSAIGNSTNHLCSTCSAGYVLSTTNCISSCPIPSQGVSYYYNTKINACSTCMTSCQECTDGVSCTICKTGYLTVQDYTSNNCVTSCPTGYTLTNTTCLPCDYRNSDGSCITCSGNTPYIYQYKCTDSCPSGLYPNTKNACVDCTNNILYKGICYDACPEKTFYDNSLKTCYTCEDRKMKYYNNTCISNCPVGSSLSKDNVCVTCQSQGKYYFDNDCVETCPFGYIENDSLSQCDVLKIQSIYINNIRCIL
jgi:hypothetical protein